MNYVASVRRGSFVSVACAHELLLNCQSVPSRKVIFKHPMAALQKMGCLPTTRYCNVIMCAEEQGAAGANTTLSAAPASGGSSNPARTVTKRARAVFRHKDKS